MFEEKNVNNNNSNTSIISQLDGKFWKRMAYRIGNNNEFVFSLDDIEHGILRANREHPSRKQSQFNLNDPRLKYSIDLFEPRIHFALNCGAKVYMLIYILYEYSNNI